MSDWRDKFLHELKNRDGIVILIDSNNVLSNDEKTIEKISEFGFDVFPYSDSISTRYFLENKKHELQNQLKIVILYSDTKSNAHVEIPFDILQECKLNGNIVPFSLDVIFPNLNIPIVEKLNPKYFDKLFYEQKNLFEPKNEIQTKEFLLQKIFGISTEIFLNNSKNFFSSLIIFHLSDKQFPQVLVDYLSSKILSTSELSNYPTIPLLTNSEFFFDFLQNEWEKTVNSNKIISVPFDETMILNNLDNLFLMGKLSPVDSSNEMHPKWMSVGIQNFDEKQKILNLKNQLHHLELDIEKIDSSSSYTEWQNLSLNFAKLYSNNYHLKNSPLSLSPLIEQINEKFTKWAEVKYKNLRTIIPELPLMVHHIFNYLIRVKNDSKIALLVMDGMSLSQWFMIREFMKQHNPKIKSQTNSIFAWIPTITSISRQSIFSGKIPYEFKDSLLTTSKEEKHWKMKWEDEKNLNKNQILYKTGTHIWNEDDVKDISLDSEVIGLVINTIDEKMHSSKGGMKDLLGQVAEWSKNSFFFEFIENLLHNNYQIFITSDHGNIEAMGIGDPPSDFDGEKGRRVRIYKNEDSMNNSNQNIESKIWWPKMAGQEYHFLLPLKNTAFSNLDKTVVTHGGDSFEEVMVPFVKLWLEE